MNNTIINIFDSEKDLFNHYPKKFHWFLSEIFSDYWDSFLDYAESHNIIIRDVVKRDVSKMIACKTKTLGYSCFKCPTCGNQKFVYHSCKSRFCNSCGIKYSKQRSLSIQSKLIDCKHRHLVFTISDFLWPIFLEDRNRLNLMFKAVSLTLNSWYKEKYKSISLTPGYILTLHTFGRDDKWNVHIHCLLSEYALSNISEKKMDFIPFDMLRKRFQTILLSLLEKDIGPSFKSLKNKVYSLSKNGFYVRAKKSEFPESKKAISYVLRYCGRPCFAQYRIIDIDNNNFISFFYQRHEDDKFVVEKIHIFEFIARLIRHIPEPQFKMIRYYGFYSSHSHKLIKSCRMLINKEKLSFLKSKNKWRNLILFSFGNDPLQCNVCKSTMKFEYGFT